MRATGPARSWLFAFLAVGIAIQEGAAYAQAAAPAIPAPAPADAAAQASRLYDSGSRHYNLAEYAEALSDFKAAYRLVPDAAFLFDIAQADRQMGESEDAAKAYRTYLNVATKASPQKRAAVEKFIFDADAIVKARAAEVGPTGVEAPGGDGVSAAPSQFPGLIQPLDQGQGRRRKPAYKRWWFWTIAGAVVVGGVATGITVSLAGRPESPLDGTLATVNAN